MIIDQRQNNFARLDYFRGIAILAVFGHHLLNSALLTPGRMQIYFTHGILNVTVDAWWEWLFYPLHFGDLGVELFFLISGFCIHWSYLQWHHQHVSPPFWPQYAIRRVFRIYPPYVFAMVMIICNGLFLKHPRNLPALRDVILHLLLIHNLDSESFYKLNGSFWSLAVECQLYLVYPLFLHLVSQLGFGIFLISSGLLVALPSIYNILTNNSLPFWITHLPFFYWYAWGLGAYVANNYFHNRCIPSLARHWLWIILIISVILAHSQFLAFMYWLGMSFVFAVWLDRSLRREETAAKNLFQVCLSGIGVVSYSVYLLHQPLIPAFESQLHHSNWWFAINILQILLSTILIGAASFICWLFVEKPSHSLGKWIASKIILNKNQNL